MAPKNFPILPHTEANVCRVLIMTVCMGVTLNFKAFFEGSSL